jgi:hypothetical protein
MSSVNLLLDICGASISYITRNTPKTTTIVMKLIEPLLSKGFTVWMDNYYNSPDLAHFLKRHNTDCIGTLRLNRKNIPQEVKTKSSRMGKQYASIQDQ